MAARVAILLSGRGSNFLALHGAMERKEVPAEIAVVVSNVAEAQGLELRNTYNTSSAASGPGKWSRSSTYSYSKSSQ